MTNEDARITQLEAGVDQLTAFIIAHEKWRVQTHELLKDLVRGQTEIMARLDALEKK